MRARIELLRWYEPRRRAYPWRTRPTPYRVLVSEIMLQQTQAPRVEPLFRAFVKRFPSVKALADAPKGEVLGAWSGLGYNRRALALQEACRVIVRDHGGRVPRGQAALRALPGVGPYTAAAVASLAFAEPVAVVDTNVRRVMARFALGMDAADAQEVAIEREAERLLDREDPGAWNSAVMDLGREVCRQASPRCAVCPLASECRFLASGTQPKKLGRRQSTFEGSFRQVRGRVMKQLVAQAGMAPDSQGGATIASLSRETGVSADRVTAAVAALADDGLVEAGPAALAGRPGGRVRLAR